MMRDAILGGSTAERLGVAALAAVTLALLAALPAWRMTDHPAPGSYAQAPEAFVQRVQDFAAGRDIVAPPPGDVPVLARRYEFFPSLELQAGQSYRLHLSSADTIHSVVVGETEILLVPGQVQVLDITPKSAGRIDLRCNEYCGLGHNSMRGSILIR